MNPLGRLSLVIALVALAGTGCGTRSAPAVTVTEPTCDGWDDSVTFTVSDAPDQTEARNRLLRAAAGYARVQVRAAVERETRSDTVARTDSTGTRRASTVVHDQERDRFSTDAWPVVLQTVPVQPDADGSWRLSVPRWQLFAPHWRDCARQRGTADAYAQAAARYAEQGDLCLADSRYDHRVTDDWLTQEALALTAWAGTVPADARLAAAWRAHWLRRSRLAGADTDAGLAYQGQAGVWTAVVDRWQWQARADGSVQAVVTLRASRPFTVTALRDATGRVVWHPAPTQGDAVLRPVGENRACAVWTATDLPITGRTLNGWTVDCRHDQEPVGRVALPVPDQGLAVLWPRGVAVQVTGGITGLAPAAAAVRERVAAWLHRAGAIVADDPRRADAELTVQISGSLDQPPATLAASDDRHGPRLHATLLTAEIRRTADGGVIRQALTVPDWTGTRRHVDDPARCARDAARTLVPEAELERLLWQAAERATE